MPHFHVSSSSNRESIRRFGLDWTRMSSAPGIAGSPTPEVEGCFLEEHEIEAEFFVRMNNTGGPVDLWRVDGIGRAELIETSNGFFYYPGKIGPDKLTLVRADIPFDPPWADHSA